MEDKRTILLQSMGYSEKAIQLILNKTNVGELNHPTLTAKQQGVCGDIMILYLKIKNDVIRDARYEYVGCAGLQSAGSALTEMVKGLSVEDAFKITDTDIIEYLEGLPKAKYECAQIAQDALHKALENYHPELID